MNPPSFPHGRQGRPLDRASRQAPINKSPPAPAGAGDQNEQLDQDEARVFGLRDRKALRPSLTSTASPMNSPKQDKQSPLMFPSRRSSSLQAFAVPPRRVSRRIVPSDLTFQSPIATKRDGLDALITNTPEDQLASELGSATGEADPTRDMDHHSLHEIYEEPDLPPTPAQLGLEKPPGRPRGLLSSSPTTQRGKWGRRRTTDLEQSPSKLRNVDDGAGIEESSDSGEATSRTLFPEPVTKKRKLKKDLSSEAKRLRESIVELEGWSRTMSQDDGNTENDLSKLIALLTSEDSSHTAVERRPASLPMSSLISTLLPFSSSAPRNISQEPPQANPFALDDSTQANPYLTVFAPLNLKAHMNTVPMSKSDTVLERHNLTFSAPSPFPSSLYNISVLYETNPDTQTLLSVSVPTHAANTYSKVPECLQQWIDSRLANPLLRLDVSGLCWGINRYWETALLRAHLWAQLEERHAALFAVDAALPSGSNKSPDSEAGMLTKSDIRRRLPHMERTSLLFESEEKATKVLLSCELTIDEWASEPQLTPGITVSAPLGDNGGSGSKVEQESKRLFHAILSEKRNSQAGIASEVDTDAIIQATDCVLGSLFGVDVKGLLIKAKTRKAK